MSDDSGLAICPVFASPEAGARPDDRGYFGAYGGRFVPETLFAPLETLARAWGRYRVDDGFLAEFARHLRHYVGRPSPLYYAERLSDSLGGANIWFKREDLNHTGAHKINNTVGQAMLARRMGKRRLIAETGAGQHGVATATVAARFDMQCVVYMGSVDIERQASNVHRMRLLGAEVIPVEAGSRTLKDALNEALRDWVAHVDDTFYVIGTAAGPHPYPLLVRDLQTVIGRETRQQCRELLHGLPDALVACVGGGSNAIGLFYPFISDQGVCMYGVEAGGEGKGPGQHAASLSRGRPGVLHGGRSYLLEDDDGQIMATHSVSAGLDYPGVGPEHAWLKDSGRAEYLTVSDDEAIAAFHTVCRTEGIIPALESCHAVAWAMQLSRTMRPEQHIVVNLSGRGDKDLASVSERLP